MKYSMIEDKESLTIKLVLSPEKDRISVKAVDKDGVEWYLFTFNEDGTVTRYKDLPEYLGLKLTKNGKVKYAMNLAASRSISHNFDYLDSITTISGQFYK